MHVVPRWIGDANFMSDYRRNSRVVRRNLNVTTGGMSEVF